MLLRVTKGGQRVRGLARLRNEQRHTVRLIDRFAVAQLRCDIDFDGEPREFLEPVLPDETGIVGRAARRDQKARGFSQRLDRKSTRLNSSHPSISYAVFCLKKKRK